MLTDLKQRKFLAAYSKCGIIGEAAKAAKMSRTMHYAWLKDPDYREQFEHAHEAAADLLEAEVINRAMYGQEEAIIYQGELQYALDENGNRTNTPLTIRKKSDVLLIFAMKGVRPEKYRDSYKADINVKADVSASHSLDLAKLTNEQLESLDNLYRAALGSGDGGAAERITEESFSGKAEEGEEQD
jgi:hypothetical protein